MTVGLNFRELLDVFATSSLKRQKEANVERMTANMGLNPTTKNELERIRKQYGMTEEQTLAYSLFVMSVLDTIVANNEAISKAINSEK
jgi:hypothetical protein